MRTGEAELHSSDKGQNIRAIVGSKRLAVSALAAQHKALWVQRQLHKTRIAKIAIGGESISQIPSGQRIEAGIKCAAQDSRVAAG